MRGAGVAADLLHCVRDRFRADPHPLRNHLGHPAQRAGQEEAIDGAGLEPAASKRRRNRRGDDLEVALVAHPPFFPVVVELVVLAPVVIDEVDRCRVMAGKPRDDVLAAEGEGRRRVAVQQFLGGAGAAAAMFRCDKEDLTRRTGPGRSESVDEPGGSRPERGSDVEGGDLGPEVERLGADPRVLSIAKGQGGGREVHRAHFVPIDPGERVPRRLDGHGDAVLVPVAHRSLAPAVRGERAVRPRVRPHDRGTLEAKTGDVGTERGDPGVRHDSFLRGPFVSRRRRPGVSRPPRRAGGRHGSQGSAVNSWPCGAAQRSPRLAVNVRRRSALACRDAQTPAASGRWFAA